MVFQGKVTVDKATMKGWIDAHQGWPALVKSTNRAEASRKLRIGFLDVEEREPLMKITWEEFFCIFDQENLAFLYQDPPRTELSRSYSFL
jgi:hypothetical protein